MSHSVSQHELAPFRTGPTGLTPGETSATLACVMAYFTVYAFEAPIRYGLAMTGLNSIILLRDLLIIVPLAYITVRQVLAKEMNWALVVCYGVLFIQIGIFYLNYHVLTPAILGAKLFINIPIAMLLGASLINATGRTFRWIVFLFVATCAGLFIEKFVVSFPWVGMSVNIGGIDVPISMDWQVDDEFARRVGGFTRISINAAGLVPILGFIVAPRCRSYLLRLLVLLVAIASVFLTTAKGALIAVLIVSACLVVPRSMRAVSLFLALVSGIVVQIVLPYATNGMLISEGTGDVFSASSFAARILYTWPTSLRYVHDTSIGLFGVGVGGLGGAVRLIAPEAAWMFTDNMYIFMLGCLGVFSLLFYGTILYLGWRSFALSDEDRTPSMALLAYIMWYGIVISGIEDQVTTVALGGAIGCLMYAARAPQAGVAPLVRNGRRAAPGRALQA